MSAKFNFSGPQTLDMATAIRQHYHETGDVIQTYNAIPEIVGEQVAKVEGRGFNPIILFMAFRAAAALLWYYLDNNKTLAEMPRSGLTDGEAAILNNHADLLEQARKKHGF